MKNIVILISGRGSNMEAVVRALDAEQWAARVAAVISNKADAKGLEFAQSRGIPTAVVPSKEFASRAEFDPQDISDMLARSRTISETPLDYTSGMAVGGAQGTCVESSSTRTWYQCQAGQWFRGVDEQTGPYGRCTSMIGLTAAK